MGPFKEGGTRFVENLESLRGSVPFPYSLSHVRSTWLSRKEKDTNTPSSNLSSPISKMVIPLGQFLA